MFTATDVIDDYLSYNSSLKLDGFCKERMSPPSTNRNQGKEKI